MISQNDLEKLRKLAAPRLGKGQILLMGGGACEDMAPSLRVLVKRCDEVSKPLLFIPHAWPHDLFDEYAQAMSSCLASVGMNPANFRCAKDLSKLDASQLAAFAAVFLGGGNTFELLHAIREAGFVNPLRNYLQAGGMLAGNSAGAIVLGRDIRHAHDPNTVGMCEFSGLDVLNGSVIWSHDCPEIHDAEIVQLRERHQFPILALADRSGILLACAQVKQIVTDGLRLVP